MHNSRRYSHIKLTEIDFIWIRKDDKSEYFRIYALWVKEKVHLRLETYLDAFKKENVIPNDLDLNEMCWAFKEVIDNVTASLPAQLQKWLEQLVEQQIIKDGRRDIKIFAQEMSLEQMKAESQKPQPSSVHYNINISENRGPIQQGGQGNIQSIISDRTKDETK